MKWGVLFRGRVGKLARWRGEHHLGDKGASEFAEAYIKILDTRGVIILLLQK